MAPQLGQNLSSWLIFAPQLEQNAFLETLGSTAADCMGCCSCLTGTAAGEEVGAAPGGRMSATSLLKSLKPIRRKINPTIVPIEENKVKKATIEEIKLIVTAIKSILVGG